MAGDAISGVIRRSNFRRSWISAYNYFKNLLKKGARLRIKKLLISRSNKSHNLPPELSVLLRKKGITELRRRYPDGFDIKKRNFYQNSTTQTSKLEISLPNQHCMSYVPKTNDLKRMTAAKFLAKSEPSFCTDERIIEQGTFSQMLYREKTNVSLFTNQSARSTVHPSAEKLHALTPAVRESRIAPYKHLYRRLRSACISEYGTTISVSESQESVQCTKCIRTPKRNPKRTLFGIPERQKCQKELPLASEKWLEHIENGTERKESNKTNTIKRSEEEFCFLEPDSFAAVGNDSTKTLNLEMNKSEYSPNTRLFRRDKRPSEDYLATFEAITKYPEVKESRAANNPIKLSNRSGVNSKEKNTSKIRLGDTRSAQSRATSGEFSNAKLNKKCDDHKKAKLIFRPSGEALDLKEKPGLKKFVYKINSERLKQRPCAPSTPSVKSENDTSSEKFEDFFILSDNFSSDSSSMTDPVNLAPRRSLRKSVTQPPLTRHNLLNSHSVLYSSVTVVFGFVLIRVAISFGESISVIGTAILLKIIIIGIVFYGLKRMIETK